MPTESSVLDKQFLFVIGAPRSGTTWLQAMIGAHPSFCTTVELTLFNRYTSPWMRMWDFEADNIAKDRWHQGLPFLWSEEEFYGFLREFLSRAYERVLETNPEATHVLDKHPGYSAHVSDIDRLLPGSKFIHIIRDGRDSALSMVAVSQKIGVMTNTIDSAAELWKKSIEDSRIASGFAGRYLELRYEDLLDRCSEVMQRVFDFCEIELSDDDLGTIVDSHAFDKMKSIQQDTDARANRPPEHYRKGKSGGWRDDMTPTQRYLFNTAAGDLLVELGYAEKRWWIDRGYHRLTLPVLSEMPSPRTLFRRCYHAAGCLLGPRLTSRVKSALSRRSS